MPSKVKENEKAHAGPFCATLQHLQIADYENIVSCLPECGHPDTWILSAPQEGAGASRPSKHPEEFRRDTVALMRSSPERTVAEIGRKLGVNHETLR